MVITLYDVSSTPAAPVEIDVDDLAEQIRRAAYRFWVSERRMPEAIIVPTQLGQVLTTTAGVPLIKGLSVYGLFPVDEMTHIPIIGRDAAIDPLFQFI